MARKVHPFAKIGRPASVKPPAPVRLASGERQGVSPMDNFKGSLPAQPYAKGGVVKYHEDGGAGWNGRGAPKGRGRY
ncbi:MAG: hypothetical protein WC829_05825 [Hyphomicrobium sp.]